MLDDLDRALLADAASRAATAVADFEELFRLNVRAQSNVKFPAELEMERIRAAQDRLDPTWARDEYWALNDAWWKASERRQVEWQEEKSRFQDLVARFIRDTAAVSRIFWPTKGRRDLQRAESLRQLVGLGEDSPLQYRHVRDNLEHFEERIEALHDATARGITVEHSAVLQGTPVTAGLIAGAAFVSGTSISVVATGLTDKGKTLKHQEVNLNALADELRIVIQGASPLLK